MRLALASSSSRFRVRPLTVVIYVIGAVLAYQSAQYLINGNFVGLAYAAIVCVCGVIVIGILRNWRNGVYFFLSWLLFEDFIRKFLGNNMAIYFAKDFLALVVLISFVAAQRKIKETNFRPPFLAVLLIFVWFGAMQVFNPASTSIWFGLMGFKIFFYYVPLLFVGYALLNSEQEFRRFFRVNISLALVIMALGITQSILGQGFLNPSQPADDLRELSTLYRVSPLTGAIAYRPTSVFVSASRYANFINVASLLVYGFAGYLLLRQKKGRLLAFIAIATAATAGFLTASRGTFLWTIINLIATSIAFIWGAPWKQGEARRVLRAVQRAALAVALGIVLLFITYPDALLSRLAIYQETLSPSSTANELTHRTWSYPIRNLLGAFGYDRWPWGYGIGTTALGGQYVARFFRVRPPVGGVESGYGTLVVEMGIGGLILWITVSSAICISAWRVVRSLKGSPWFPVGFVLFWYSFVLLFPSTFAGIQSYEDYLLNAYLWLGLGLLFRLPTIALSSPSETVARAGQIQPGWIR
jgi:hypothetical protein